MEPFGLAYWTIASEELLIYEIGYYLMYFLVLQLYWRGRESCLLCFNCLPYVMWLFVFCCSSSWCFVLVCSVWLWYFLIMLTYFCMYVVKQETLVFFVYKYSKGLDVPVCASTHSHQKLLEAQWLSGRVHISRLTNCGFEPLCHCVGSLSKSHWSLLNSGSTKEDPSQHNWKIVESIQTNNRNFCFRDFIKSA